MFHVIERFGAQFTGSESKLMREDCRIVIKQTSRIYLYVIKSDEIFRRDILDVHDGSVVAVFDVAFSSVCNKTAIQQKKTQINEIRDSFKNWTK